MFDGLLSLLGLNQDDKKKKKKQQQPVKVVQQESRPLALNSKAPIQVKSAKPQSNKDNGISRLLGDIGRAVKPAIDATVDTVSKAANTATLAGGSIVAAQTGANRIPQVQKALKQTLDRSFVSPQVASGKASPVQFAKDIANAGVQTSNLVPTKGVVTGLANGLSRAAVKTALTSNAKQAAVFGTANTINEAAQGHQVTPQSLAVNYGAPFALGAGSQVAGGALRSGAKLHQTATARDVASNGARKAAEGGSFELPSGRKSGELQSVGDILKKSSKEVSPVSKTGSGMKSIQASPDALPQEMWPLAKIANEYKTPSGFSKAVDRKLVKNKRNPETFNRIAGAKQDAGDLKEFFNQVKGSTPVRDITIKAPRSKVTKYVAVNTLDNNAKPTYDLIPLDKTKHTLSNGMVTDKKGRPVGSYLGVDEQGNMTSYVEGKPVNINSIIGDVEKWGNTNKSLTDMNRLIERNAPDAATARKTQDFTTVYKDKQEAAMKTAAKQDRDSLSARERVANQTLPQGINRKELSEDLFDAANGKADLNLMRQKYGDAFMDQTFVPELARSRQWYDMRLDRANNVLQRNGFDPIPKRDNYITHIQDEPDFWQKAGIGIQDLNPMGSSVSSDINPGRARGGVPDEIVGNTANTNARRKFNQFAQQRKGNSAVRDFWAAQDAYIDPILHNEYMTPAASRTRVIEKAFRLNDKAREKQLEEMAAIVGIDQAKQHMNAVTKRTNPNYEAGRKSPLVMAWQEYGNMLAGKTNAIDRTIIDAGGQGGQKALSASVKLQGITGASSIPGSATAAAAQVLSLPQTIARDSISSVLKATKDMLAFEGKRAGKTDPIRQSAFMRARYTDASSQRVSAVRNYTNKASVPMQTIERTTGELSWRSAYHEALKKGETGQRAIDSADLAAKKTLAGRGIGDRPMAMNSKALGAVTQFGLEVNNMRLQFFNDFTPKQKLKFIVAAAALNYVYKGVTGNAPLPDVIGAGVSTASDFVNSNDDKKDTPWDNTVQAGQRALSEGSKFIPGASTLTGLLPDDTREKIFGTNSDLSRFGAPPLTKAITTGTDALGKLVGGDFWGATKSAGSLAPTGTQVKRSTEGIETMLKGYGDSGGKVTSTVDQSNPFNWAQALIFGKNSLPGQQQFNASGFKLSDKESDRFKDKLKTDPQSATDFFNKKIDSKVDNSNRAGTLTAVGQAPKANATEEAKTAQDLLDQNKERSTALKESLSDEDYALTQLSKADRAKLVKAGVVTKDKLTGLDNYVKNKKKELGYDDTTTDLPTNLAAPASKVLSDYTAAEDKKAWASERNDNQDIAKSLSAWTGGKVEVKDISNEVAKQWADYQKDVADGTVSKLKATTRKKSILKKALGSQLDDTEQEIFSLSKADIAGYLADGTISEQNIINVLAVERKQFDAGLITKESFASKIGQPARSKSKSSSGSGSGKSKSTSAKSFKLPTDVSHKYRTKGARIAREAKVTK